MIAPAARSRLANIATGCMVAFFSTMIALAMSEAAVRLIAPQRVYRFPQGLFAAEAPTGYKLASHFRGRISTGEFKTQVRTNALGFREDSEYDSLSAARVQRVLVIGDSFAMGVGVDVEDSFEKVLERRLNSESREGTYQVINAGVAGYGTRDAIRRLRVDGIGLKPQLVVLTFFIGNDLEDNVSPSPVVVDGFLQSGPDDEGLLPAPIRHFLSRRSHLYALVWPFQRRLRDPGFARDVEQAVQRHMGIYDGEENEAVRQMWTATGAALTTLRDSVSEADAHLMVLVVPELLQVDDDRWQTAVRTAGAGRRYVRSLPNERLRRLSNDLGFSIVDTLVPLQSTERPRDFYFPVDSHWTPMGHRLAADMLYEALQPELPRVRQAHVESKSSRDFSDQGNPRR